MPDIHQSVLIGASAENVYRALTTQEGLAAWWTPDTTARAEVNSIARFPFGPDYFKEMKITQLKPGELVKWTCISGAAEWTGTALSFTLLPGSKATLLRLHPEAQDQIGQQSEPEGTLLIFRHDGWREDTPMFAECSYTWGQFLRSLKLLCETGEGRPWPNQHRAR
ncbi:SRPBCC domain-containing protein [Puia sp.]|jgi:uncharacterized protein YndB with AHSA1/START domain|uniref:SRPBCC family protein n=1 Tax=Puia sp. TaxID=2045100 RepID=UPI002F3E3812